MSKVPNVSKKVERQLKKEKKHVEKNETKLEEANKKYRGKKYRKTIS